MSGENMTKASEEGMFVGGHGVQFTNIASGESFNITPDAEMAFTPGISVGAQKSLENSR